VVSRQIVQRHGSQAERHVAQEEAACHADRLFV
jgi:hypothetical protein